MTAAKRPQITDFRLDLPERRVGPWSISRYEVSEDAAAFENLRAAIGGSSRPIRPGTYTRLMHDNRGVVMSDTPAELRDLQSFSWHVRRPATRRVLIHGLGLGLAAAWALQQPHVEHVDVVEIDRDIVRLVGPSLSGDRRLFIHVGDALTYRFPVGAKWDVVWHDIWDAITSDNLPEVTRLKRRYGRRCGWQGVWAEHYMREGR